MNIKFRILTFSVVTSIIGACGGDDGPTSPTPATTTIATRTVVVEDSASIGSQAVYGTYFTTTSIGTLEVTVDWTVVSNTIWVSIARGRCGPTEFPDECDLLVRSQTASPKPRVLTLANATAGEYTLIIENHGPVDDRISYQVVLMT